MAEATITVEVDTEIGAAYIQLSDAEVARTEEYSEDINVDLDELGVVVGIELLDTLVTVPLDDLTVRYHIQSRALARLIASITFHPRPSHTVMVATGSQTTQTPYGGIAAGNVAGSST